MAQLPPDLPVGYHDLLPDDGGPVTRLAVAPRSCPPPPSTWGWSAQLYALRSRWSWGVGDLGDLRDLVGWTSGLGGGAVLVNPLHANVPVLPQQPSPYYPSSRRFRNIIYLRIADVPGATLLGSELAPLDHAGRALTSGPRHRPRRGPPAEAPRTQPHLRRPRPRRRRRAVPPLAGRARPVAGAVGPVLHAGRAPRRVVVELARRAPPPGPAGGRREGRGRRSGSVAIPRLVPVAGAGPAPGGVGRCGRRGAAGPGRRLRRRRASTPGATRTCWRSAAASARRRTSWVPRGRTGGCRRTSRGSSGPRSSSPSGRR